LQFRRINNIFDFFLCCNALLIAIGLEVCVVVFVQLCPLGDTNRRAFVDVFRCFDSIGSVLVGAIAIIDSLL
jgi:hypothetical protein